MPGSHRTAPLTAILAGLMLNTFNAWAESAADCSTASEMTVAEFYDLAINQKDFAAAEKYMGPHYIQHNPGAPDGKAGLEQYINYLRTNMPDYHSEIKSCFSEGAFVILHIHNKPTPDALGRAVVDIFRLEDGKVVEHWDVIQDIPENPQNDNTMF